MTQEISQIAIRCTKIRNARAGRTPSFPAVQSSARLLVFRTFQADGDLQVIRFLSAARLPPVRTNHATNWVFVWLSVTKTMTSHSQPCAVVSLRDVELEGHIWTNPVCKGLDESDV